MIGISGIVGNYASLNGGIYGVTVTSNDTFTLSEYSATDDEFSEVVSLPNVPYEGGGLINIRENFSVQSKKFNFLDEGQNIQLGYIDILMVSTGGSNDGAISLNVYLNYDDENVSNVTPDNTIDDGLTPEIPDTFFNSIIPTTSAGLNQIKGTKFWQRVYCSTRANFITLEYLFNNEQLAGVEQQLPVQIDAQILWIRKGGRMTNI